MHRPACVLVSFVVLAASAGCGGCQQRAAQTGPKAGAESGERVLTIVATAEVRGTPEPCGCQSDPLGDVARVASLVKEAERAAGGRGGAILVDAGGLRYGAEKIAPERAAQAELKADFLEQAWLEQRAIVGLGDEDLARGPEKVPASRRLCSNIAGVPVAAPPLRDVGGVKVGAFGVIDPAKEEAWHAAGVKASDPTEAARAATAKLRGEGAQVVVALAHLARPAARKLAREVPGISVVIVGDDVGEEGGEPEQVGETILIAPAQEALKAARIELHVVDGKASATLFAGAEERQRSLARLDKRIDQAGRDLLKLKADPTADPGFVATKEAELARFKGEREKLRSSSPTPPAGPYAIAQLVEVRRKIPRDPAIEAAMKQLDARVGEANRAAAEKIPPPPAAEGEPGYTGDSECEDCHKKAVDFWKTTVHAKAWTELVEVNKQWSYDCISCHVTGYGRPGGSSMAHVEGGGRDLKAVQCEVCHGPGSQHNETPKKVHLRNPVEADCKECHTKEHSDTFQYEAYLRDVLGPGHGEKKRAALGPGVTGYALRHGAMERAKEK